MNTMMDPPAYGCPAGFNRKQTGAVALANATSKETVNTTIAPIYSCLRCAQQDRAAIIGTGVTIGALPGAQAYLDQALAETQAAIDTSNNVLLGTCLTALQTSGTWTVSYGAFDCGPVGDEPSGQCDPRSAPRSGSLDCSTYDFSDPMYPIYIPRFTNYNATCPQVTALPPGC